MANKKSHSKNKKPLSKQERIELEEKKRQERAQREAQRTENDRKKKKKKKIIIICVILAILIIAAVVTTIIIVNSNTVDRHVAVINIRGYGEVRIILDEVNAPKTVKNFISLAQAGYYNGTYFYGVQNESILLGGSKGQDGTKDKNAASINGEFTANGFNNTLSHGVGVIAMVRGDNIFEDKTDTTIMGDARFFILNKEYAEELDGYYATFGVIESGLDVIQRIIGNAELDENGSFKSGTNPVIESIVIETESVWQ